MSEGWEATMGFVVLALAGCVVGGGEDSWGFESATALDVELGDGEVHIVSSSEEGRTVVNYDGGGLGRAARPDVFLADDGTVFVDGRGGIGGGDFDIAVARGIPITALVSRGELTIELDTPADIDACVAAGQVSIGVPPGPYDLDLAAGVGAISVEIIDQEGAEYFITACTGAGEIDIHVFDESGQSD